MRRTALLALAAVLTGCSYLMPKDPISSWVSSEVARSERLSLESRTLSSLAAIERSLNDYIRAKKGIPGKLDLLLPEYLAEIPAVVTGVLGHKDSSRVRYYQAGIISGGQVDGARIDDTGGWGYVYNDHQVIVFVDCTHKTMKGMLWYQMRGVY